MRHRATTYARTAVLLICSTAGCAQHSAFTPADANDSTASQFSPVELTERGELAPDVTALAAPDAPASESDTPETGTSEKYLVLRENQVKCTAAEAAPLANLSETEAELARVLSSGVRCTGNDVHLIDQLLGYRAAHERNQAASQALQLYFYLAEAEASHDRVQEALAQVARMRRWLDGLRDTSFDLPVGEGELYRRENALLEEQAQLKLTIAQLNGQLRQILGMDVDDPTPLWPAADLQVQPESIDADRAVTVGLSMRPDLAAIEVVADYLGESSLQSARQSLQSADALLGIASTVSPKLKLLQHHASGDEVAYRREQLNRLLVARQRTAAQEIRQAVLTVSVRLRQVRLAKERLASWRKEVDRLERTQDLDDSNAFSIAQARLERLAAGRELLSAVVAWEVARVKLKEAQGLLACECGYTECPAGDACMPDRTAPAANAVDDAARDDAAVDHDASALGSDHGPIADSEPDTVDELGPTGRQPESTPSGPLRPSQRQSGRDGEPHADSSADSDSPPEDDSTGKREHQPRSGDAGQFPELKTPEDFEPPAETSEGPSPSSEGSIRQPSRVIRNPDFDPIEPQAPQLFLRVPQSVTRPVR